MPKRGHWGFRLSEIMQDFLSLRSFHFDFMSVLLYTKRPSCLDFSVRPVSPLGSLKISWPFRFIPLLLTSLPNTVLLPKTVRLARSFLEMRTIRFRRLAIRRPAFWASNYTVKFLPLQRPFKMKWAVQSGPLRTMASYKLTMNSRLLWFSPVLPRATRTNVKCRSLTHH